MRPLHHIGYWVDDLAKAAARARETLGVGPFLRHSHVTFESFTLADGTEVTDPSYFDHSAMFTAWGGIVLELAQVHEAHPDIVDAYKVKPGATSHVSWVVDDLEAETKRLEGQGCALIHTASLGPVNVAWHHGGELFPHPIEVHLASAPILAMHARLTELAAAWDGNELIQPMIHGS